MKSTRTDRLTTLSRLFLVVVAFAFLGWLYETVYLSLANGRFLDRGFLTLPLCPIYGCCLVALYCLLGTPNRPQGILKNFRHPLARYAMYCLFAGLIPTVVELVVGAFFHQLFDVRLWTYETHPLNFYGYICLPISLFWAFAITAVMRLCYWPIHRLVEKIPNRAARITALVIGILMSMDTVYSFFKL